MKSNKGITTVALIITIIVTIILAVVSIQAIKKDGIIAHAKNARNSFKEYQENEKKELKKLFGGSNEEDKVEEKDENDKKEVNAPLLKTGMVPVKYDVANNAWKVTTADDVEWYNYLDTDLIIDGKTVKARTWANVMLQDGLEYNEGTGLVIKEGSMYVWIPRYAYKITKLTSSDYTEKVVSGSYRGTSTERAGLIEVKYLQGTTDNYKEGQAVRENSAESKYVVHPSFTNNVDLGGWDTELSGYWVSKFEAAYAGQAGNSNSANDSSVSYTKTWGYNGATNREADILNNYYGQNQIKDGDNFKKIKYPTFTGNKSSFNYISPGDAYSLCLALNETGNPYGINTNSETHLMKNSEWGAVAYLAHSKYGRNGQEVLINDNRNISDASINGKRTVWAVTGGGDYKTNIGQSTTNNIYGIYDLSGGLYERTACYVKKSNTNITTYGLSMKTSESNKYVTLYDRGTTDNRVRNYIAAKKLYGDAITETSLFDETKTASTSADYNYNFYAGWFQDNSNFPYSLTPFFIRGGIYTYGNSAGTFAYNGASGSLDYYDGFRAVLA